MTLEPVSLLALVLLGGLVGLDTVSFTQAMLSRPIVAGPLAGWLLGDAATGAWAGALLEVVSLRQLPVGAARHWDTGPAAVGAAAAAVALSGGPAALLVGVAFGVIVGWAGAGSLHLTRQLNARLAANEAQAPWTARQLSSRHLAALGLDFLRAAVLTLISVGLVAGPVAGLGARGVASEAAIAALVLACTSLALGADVGVMARGPAVRGAFGAAALLGAIVSLWLS